MAKLGEFDVAVRENDPDREPDTFTLCGETFTVADQVGIIPLAQFAKAASSGLDSAEMDGMAALIDVVKQCVVDEDAGRFLKLATEKRMDADLLLEIVKVVMEAQTGRPTGQPSASVDGLQTTTASSKEASSLEAWRNSPLGRREIAAAPEVYADVHPIRDAAAALAG